MGIIRKVLGKSKPSVIKRIIDRPEDYELVARIEGEEISVRIRTKNISLNEEATSNSTKEEVKMFEKLKKKTKDWYEEYEDLIGNYAAAYVPAVIVSAPLVILAAACQAYFNAKFKK